MSEANGRSYQTEGKVSKLFFGHNDEILDVNPYLDHLEAAVQAAVDYGQAALKPTLRSAEESFGSKWIAVCGNYQMDQNWAAVNVGRVLTEGITSENNCLLSWVQFEDSVCEPLFQPDHTEYEVSGDHSGIKYRLVPNSTRSLLSVNGKPVKAREAVTHLQYIIIRNYSTNKCLLTWQNRTV
ncbi:MAG: hypothetical protein ACOYBC_07975 [Bilifractor sp.]